ncbi:MAG TPA: phosphate ABC transporter permease PstA [Methanothrix sp.]|nr:phosphate ABC transporter permease PstA [Methanothrix sp.]
MKIKPTLALSLILSAMLLLTALFSLLLQPDPERIRIFWLAGLAANILLLIGSYLTSRAASMKTALFLALDVAICSAVLYLIYSGAIHAGFSLRRPLGLGASFDDTFLLPLLILICSLLCIKDALNIIYDYSARGREALVFLAVRMSAILSMLLLGGILFAIIYKGIWAINLEFLTMPHRRLGQAGGISTAIMGSFWMVLGAMIISSPLGIGAAIYLHEYSRSQKFNRLITIAVSCLNGVPSVVFGLFGLAFLVRFFGVSLLSGSIILGLINIPTIILTYQEALKSVPNSLREGSMALGATKWQTIKKVVLPSAMPGILTGVIMGVAKASGETAPIMWTAVTFTATPVHMIYGIIPDLFQPVNNLDYHLLNLIYFLGAWDVEAKAWGTALVLIAVVLGTNMLAIVVRNRYRKKISW